MMFTEQIATLQARLRESGLPDGAVTAIADAIGSCMGSLAQRGTVELPGLVLRQIPPQGQQADQIMPPQFTVPPIGTVQLAKATGPPVADGDNWRIPAIPVGDLGGGPIGNPPPGGKKPFEPDLGAGILVVPTGDGAPVVNSGDIIQYSWVPEAKFASSTPGRNWQTTYTPKAFETQQENPWLTNLRQIGVTITGGLGDPVDDITGQGTAGLGSLYVNTVTGTWWENIGTKEHPMWTIVFIPITT